MAKSKGVVTGKRGVKRGRRGASRGPARAKAEPRSHLLNPEFKIGANGKVESITGTCAEAGCRNTRTIKPQDAFQVRRCVECQKKALYRRLAEKRKAKGAGRRADAR